MSTQVCEANLNDKQSKDAAWFAEQVAKHARNDPVLAVEIAEQALTFFELNPNPELEALVLNESAYALYFLGKKSESMQRAKLAQEHAQQHGLADAVARAQVLQANALQSAGLFEKAIALYRKTLAYYRQQNDVILLSRVLNNIGNTFFSAKQYQQALEFYQQASELSDSTLTKALYNLGTANCYARLGDIPRAIEGYQLAYQFYGQLDDTLGKELALTGLGEAFQSMGEHIKALSIFEQALSLAHQSQRNYHLVSLLQSKLTSLIALQRFDEASRLAKLALDKAELLGDTSQSAAIHRELMVLYRKTNDFDLFIEALEKAQQLEAESRQAQQQMQMAVTKVVLDAEAKDHQIKLLRAETEVQQLQLEQQRFFSLVVVVVILLLAMLFAFGAYRQVQNKKLKHQQVYSQKLEQLNDLKNQLLANTSHELRTPLNGIIGLTELLEENQTGNLNEQQLQQIAIIGDCGDRLLRLIEDIIDLSRLQSNQMKIEKQPIDIVAITEDVVSLLAPLASEKGLELAVKTEAKEVYVLADKARLHQVLNNLVGNAIKFSIQGNILVHIGIQGHSCLITVSDQGPGIPSDRLKDICEPFFQIDNSHSRQQQGTGLGLAITQQLLILHQSELQVASIVGQGSAFSFSLPLVSG